MDTSAKIFCPTCQAYRQPVLKKRLENFQVIGESMVCPVCKNQLPAVSASSPKNPGNKGILSNTPPARKGLQELFGISSNEASRTSVLEKTGEQLAICRDCRWCILSPFECRCTKFNRLVEPTDDCTNFQKRPEKGNAFAAV